jgi:hypothetical protein
MLDPMVIAPRTLIAEPTEDSWSTDDLPFVTIGPPIEQPDPKNMSDKTERFPETNPLRETDEDPPDTTSRLTEILEPNMPWFRTDKSLPMWAKLATETSLPSDASPVTEKSDPRLEIPDTDKSPLAKAFD